MLTTYLVKSALGSLLAGWQAYFLPRLWNCTIRSLIEDKDPQLPKMDTFRLSIEERRFDQLISKNPYLLRKSDTSAGKALELRIGQSLLPIIFKRPCRARTIRTALANRQNQSMLHPWSKSTLPDIPSDLYVHTDCANRFDKGSPFIQSNISCIFPKQYRGSLIQNFAIGSCKGS